MITVLSSSFDTTDVTGSITLPEGIEMVMPGDTLEMEVELGKPVALEARMDLAIREGGRTVGAGRIVSVGFDRINRPVFIVL